MSYILDALRRADAERELGRVPNLNTPTAPASPGDTPPRRPRLALLLGAAAGAALVLAGVWLTRTPPLQDAPPPPPAPPTTPAPSPVAATSAPAPAAQAPASTAPPAQAVLPLLATPPAQAATAAPAAPATATTTPAATPSAAQATRPPAAGEDIPRFADLSPEVRAQLPALNLSGSTYAKNPALRMLIINGKVVQEGQDISPGLKLESIGPRSAVLNHQGLRYRIGY